MRCAVCGIRCITITPFFHFSPCKWLTCPLLLNSTDSICTCLMSRRGMEICRGCHHLNAQSRDPEPQTPNPGLQKSRN